MKILELKKLCFSYNNKNQILDNIHLKIKTDKITLLVGENGAGKSTLINILTGQLNKFLGQYTIDQIPVNTIKGEVLHLNKFGYSPEIPVLDSYLSGLEIIQLIGDIRGIHKNDTDKIVDTFKEPFQLNDWFYNKYCSEYSKGMRKKVSILQALFPQLSYSIMDEPFEGLDPISLLNLKQLLLNNREKGIGCFLSSHMLDIAEKISDHIIFIKKGKILYNGAFEDLKNSWPNIESLDELYFKLYNQGANGKNK